MNQREFDLLVYQWTTAKENLEVCKNIELDLRKQIVELLLDQNRLEKFSKTFQLGNDYALRATNIVSYKLESKDRVIEVIDKLSDIGKAGISTLLFKWNCELSETTYKSLDEDTKSIVDEILTIKPGTPQLEFIEPKEDK